jgi:oxygen-dependent protoporphyrinogen oxidase
MGQLVDALLSGLGPSRLRTGARVRALRRRDAELRAELVDGSTEACRQLVLATPARAAAALLAPLGLAATQPLALAATSSNVSVNLSYAARHLPALPAGSGLLFPDGYAARGLRALSIVQHKLAGRAPHGQALLRVFFRPSGEALAQWDDARFAAEASGAVASVLGATAPPECSWVTRWVDALPVFSPALREQVAAADAALSPLGIHLAGSAFHGAGIDAAVASAARVAARLGV